jgi:hypothetical protein
MLEYLLSPETLKNKPLKRPKYQREWTLEDRQTSQDSLKKVGSNKGMSVYSQYLLKMYRTKIEPRLNKLEDKICYVEEVSLRNEEFLTALSDKVGRLKVVLREGVTGSEVVMPKKMILVPKIALKNHKGDDPSGASFFTRVNETSQKLMKSSIDSKLKASGVSPQPTVGNLDHEVQHVTKVKQFDDLYNNFDYRVHNTINEAVRKQDKENLKRSLQTMDHRQIKNANEIRDNLVYKMENVAKQVIQQTEVDLNESTDGANRFYRLFRHDTKSARLRKKSTLKKINSDVKKKQDEIRKLLISHSARPSKPRTPRKSSAECLYHRCCVDEIHYGPPVDDRRMTPEQERDFLERNYEQCLEKNRYRKELEERKKAEEEEERLLWLERKQNVVITDITPTSTVLQTNVITAQRRTQKFEEDPEKLKRWTFDGHDIYGSVTSKDSKEKKKSMSKEKRAEKVQQALKGQLFHHQVWKRSADNSLEPKKKKPEKPKPRPNGKKKYFDRLEAEINKVNYKNKKDVIMTYNYLKPIQLCCKGEEEKCAWSPPKKGGAPPPKPKPKPVSLKTQKKPFEKKPQATKVNPVVKIIEKKVEKSESEMLSLKSESEIEPDKAGKGRSYR